MLDRDGVVEHFPALHRAASFCPHKDQEDGEI
jgi:hypothetical protein